MSRGSPFIDVFAFLVKQSANLRGFTKELDMSPGNLFVSRSIQRLDLHERLTLIW
jgi:hypothetical protein